MPLDKQKLAINIRKINDESFSGFEGWPDNYPDACERWSEVIRLYFQDVFPYSMPVDKSLKYFGISSQVYRANHLKALELSKQAMKSYLLKNRNVYGFVFEFSITLFISTYISFPNLLWTSSMPLADLNLTFVKNGGLGGETSEWVSTNLANKIQAWAITGTAINNISGASVKWT